MNTVDIRPRSLRTEHKKYYGLKNEEGSEDMRWRQKLCIWIEARQQ